MSTAAALPGGWLSEGEHFATFCAEYLVQSVEQWEGLPLTLEAYQRRFMNEAMQYGTDGWPVWSSVVLVVARKNGKTTLLAGYALYRLLTSGGYPEILLAASSDKQAGRLFDAAALFVRRNPELSRLLRVRDHAGEIAREDGQGKIIRMSSDPGRLHGYNPSLVICDELAQWTTPSLVRAWAALTTGGGARRQAQTFTITTAGEANEREEGILGRLVDGNEAAGEVEQPVPGLTISRNVDAGTLVYNFSAGEGTTRHDLERVRWANPASWITDEYLAKQAANPELTDAQFLQLHACVWAAGSGTFIAPSEWRRLGDGQRIPPGSRVCLGADGSRTYDTSVVAWAHKAEDGRVDVDARIFSVRQDAPHHVLHGGGKIDFEALEEFIIDRFELFEVAEAAYDPRYLERSAEILDARLPEASIIVVYPQSVFMRDAVAAFHRGVADGTVRHQGDAAIAAHVAACKAEQDERGWVISKRKQNRPIDAVPAMALAYWRALEEQGAVVPLAAWA